MIGEVSPKEVVRRVVSAWNTGDPAFVHRYYADDFAFESSTGEVTDRAGYRDVVTGVQDAFDDLEVETQYLVAEKDRVIARVVLSGIHAGEFRGVAATGETVEFDSAFCYRVADGEIVHEEHLTDNLGLLEQLGAAPDDS